MSQMTKNEQGKMERPNTGDRFVMRPRVDVLENEAEYLLIADLPGVVNDGVDVRFAHGELTIEAKRAETAAGAPVRQEYRFGEYRRAFTLPEGVDADKISAKLANGVLSVHVPKAEAQRARRIEVRAG